MHNALPRISIWCFVDLWWCFGSVHRNTYTVHQDAIAAEFPRNRDLVIIGAEHMQPTLRVSGVRHEATLLLVTRLSAVTTPVQYIKYLAVCVLRLHALDGHGVPM